MTIRRVDPDRVVQEVIHLLLCFLFKGVSICGWTARAQEKGLPSEGFKCPAPQMWVRVRGVMGYGAYLVVFTSARRKPQVARVPPNVFPLGESLKLLYVALD